ncbi:MAG TPA: DUF3179 domain-containing protein [Nitrososphaeraceae archaeon]|nr:DUF3179 domain-containing protein [Nitrososphaeraceae archaeon]
MNYGNNFMGRFNKRHIDLAAISIVSIILAIFISVNTNILVNFTPPSTSPVSKIIGDNDDDNDDTNLAAAVAQDKNNIVPLDQIVSGGPPPDGIQSIDNPKFISVQEAEEFLEDSDLVVGLDINEDIRAYPLQILVWHEIVNDMVGETPVAVTYCPLCFTNQVFNRTVNDGQILEFGTSGKLYNSNLVMYDRTTKSLWSQAMSQAIVGELAGVKLGRIPFDVAYWKDWKQMFPDSKVLSRDTGSSRPYGVDPYGDYYISREVLFPIAKHDDRLGPKEIMIGFENEGQYKAYRLQDVEKKKVINDQVNTKPITLFSSNHFMTRAYNPILEGQTTLQFEYNAKNNTLVDKQTRSQWNFDGKAIDGQMKGKQLIRLPFDQGFWFEWIAFHPTTELYVSAS